MRHLLEFLPGAQLPDPVRESEAPGAPLIPPDDDDLVRPNAEDALFVTREKGSLAGREPGALAKHLVRTFGPIHPALPFPIALRVEIDGDRLVTVDPEVGFLHQGLERAAELVGFERVLDVVARASPLAPLPLVIATSLAIERLAGVSSRVPRRAVLWRTAALEVGRIAEHLRVVSSPALAVASRRHARALADAAREMGGLFDAVVAGETFAHLGGLSRALDGDEAARLLVALPRAADAARSALELLAEEPSRDAHLAGVARLTAQGALSFGLSGPALRACGVQDDARSNDEGLLQRAFGLRVCTETSGCARARVRVRLAEVEVSASIAARALEALADAAPEIAVAVGMPPPGVASAAVEAHHGEVLVTIASDGTQQLRRVRMRTPSAALASALRVSLVGVRIDDVVAAIASFGIVGTEVDR
jgi:NADH-quinone oxidoreductase subunit D